ncbi:hypothetical protein GCM10009718_33050 [Isoptericola halotolerans]|uniref:Uncharacterized protein n=1 Tax=Isoptericola halotolerans TaxID=300560 RepID=A0ABX2A8D3_9MICO|nr:hypothetical protein [Isoptericola halotolerans]NOV98193.1 hypothetical protein [Isoptericola halotolerans]
MSTVTSTQAGRISARTAQVVANMRAEADALEAAGAPDDVISFGMTRAEVVRSQRETADSRERAGGRATVGARIGRA